MVKEKEEKQEKKQEARVNVVTLSDYIGRVGNDLSGSDKVKAALILLYTENKILGITERKGEAYYIVEKI